MLIFKITPTLANGSGGHVVAGNASIQSNGPQQIINQDSQRAIIEWEKFGIKPNESVEFRQPNQGATLNRVIGNEGSILEGILKANGEVILVNPYGILTTKTAKIDVGSFIASTSNIRNQDFMEAQNGKYEFMQPGHPTASISHQGEIKVKDTGLVALVAPGVECSGIIRANLGRVVLASGSKFTLNTLDTYGDGLIRFAANDTTLNQYARTLDGRELKDAAVTITNAGQIDVPGGKVILTTDGAKQLVAESINMHGVIKATTAIQRPGEIILLGNKDRIVSVTGKMDVSGKEANQKGGNVKIAGERVYIKDKAFIDASGTKGGGEVLIGGDYQGKKIKIGNTEYQNANYVFKSKESEIEVSAIDNGDGGRVILFSELGSKFGGKFIARGGMNGGNGGLIETSVSAQGNLQSIGILAIANAPKGTDGLWYIDPNNIIINTTTTTNVSTNTVDNTETFTPNNTSGMANIENTDIEAALNNDTNVVITTTGAGVPGQNGDIEIAATITKSAGNNATLTLNADNTITQDALATISSTSGMLNVVFNSFAGITLNDNIVTNGGNVTMTTTANVAGTITINGGITSNNGNVSLNGLAGISNGVQGFVNSGSGLLSLQSQSTSDITLSNTFNTNSFQNVIFSGRNVTLRTSQALSLGASTLHGNLSIESGNLSQTGALTSLTAGSTMQFTPIAASESIVLNNSGNNFVSTISFGINPFLITTLNITNTNSQATLPDLSSLTGLRNLTINFPNSTSLFTIPTLTLGSLSITVNGPIVQSGPLSVTGLANFTVVNSNESISITNNSNNLRQVGFSTSSAASFYTTSSNVRINTTSVGELVAETTGTSIQQSGSGISVGGLTEFILDTSNTSIDLSNNTNDFGSTILFTNPQNLASLDLINTDPNASVPDFSGATNLQFLTLTFTTAGMALPSLSLISDGSIQIEASGDITQNGSLNIPGTSSSASFLSDTGGITLNDPNNVFEGPIQLNNNNPVDISLVAVSPLTLDFCFAGQNLSVAAGGAITQSNTVTVTNNSSFSAGSNPITLIDPNLSNSFGGLVSLFNNGANDVTVQNDLLPLQLGTSNVGQNLNANSQSTLSLNSSIVIGGALNYTALNSPAGILVPSDASLTAPNLAFNNTVDGPATLTLDVGSSGAITFNNDVGGTTPLTGLVVTNAQDFTNLGTINAGFFQQSAGTGTTSLGGSTLITSGNAVIETNNATGRVQVGGLTLDVNSANLTGTVGGLTNGSNIVLSHRIQPGQVFFNGIDLFIYQPKPPVPPVPPIPPIPPVPPHPPIPHHQIHSAMFSFASSNIPSYVFDGSLSYFGKEFFTVLSPEGFGRINILEDEIITIESKKDTSKKLKSL